MTSPQNPWESGPGQQGPYQQYPGGPQYPGGQQYPGAYQPGTPSGGFPQPGYGQQYPGYPQQGAYPPVNPYAAPPVSPYEAAGGVQRPRTVEIAFWIATVVPVLVTVLYAVNMLFAMQMINETLDASGVPASQADEFRSVVGGVAMFFFVAGIVILAILTGLWILFGFKMRAGRNWARVTLTVFASLWVLMALSGLVTGGSTFSTTGDLSQMQTPTGLLVLSYLQSAIGLLSMIAFLVLVYLKPSNWFFQATARY